MNAIKFYPLDMFVEGTHVSVSQQIQTIDWLNSLSGDEQEHVRLLHNEGYSKGENDSLSNADDAYNEGYDEGEKNAGVQDSERARELLTQAMESTRHGSLHNDIQRRFSMNEPIKEHVEPVGLFGAHSDVPPAEQRAITDWFNELEPLHQKYVVLLRLELFQEGKEAGLWMAEQREDWVTPDGCSNAD